MRRLHPYSGALRAIGNAVSLGSIGLFVGVSLVGIGLEGLLHVAAIVGLALLGAVLGAIYGVVRYRRFEYETADGTFSMASGVFNRQERDIPYGRIQNVDIRRSLLQRVLGLATVNLETAGGGATEAVLNAVDVDEAERIQDAVAGYERAETGERAVATNAGQIGTGDDAIGTREEGTGTAGELAEQRRQEQQPDRDEETEAHARTRREGPERETLFELSTEDLALLSAVSFDPSGLALLLFSLPFGQEYIFALFARTVEVIGGPTLPSLSAVTGLPSLQLAFVLLIAVIQFLVAAWIASGLVTAIKYYDFRLTRVGEDLRYERGLFQRYTGTIPLEKVQTITVRENLPMRATGYAALDLETAGYGPDQGGNASNTAIPLDDRDVVIALAERLGGVEYPSIERPPKRSRRRYAVRLSLIPLALTAVLLALHTTVWTLPRWWIPLLALPLAPIGGHYMWKHRGHALTDDAFLARSSFWRRHTRIVPYYRIQTVIDSRSVFQRWRSLASVTADTASTASVIGGDATAHDVDESTAIDLHHTLRERLAADLARRRTELRSQDDGASEDSSITE